IIKTDKYYDLKDEFLLNTISGKKYSKLFYVIGDHFGETLDFELTSDILNLLPQVNDAIDNLLDENYTGVIITTQLKNDLIDLLDYSKGKSSSQVYKNTIDLFKTDVTNFSNKNRQQL